MIRNTRVAASDSHNAEDDRSAAVVTSESSGKGDIEMSVSDEERVEFRTSDEMA